MAGPEQFGQLNIWGGLKSLWQNALGPFALAGTPTNGTSGTLAGKAGVGALLLDYTNGALYINTGTKASPLWSSASGAVAAIGGLGNISNAKMTYDFATDGGAQGLITPTNSPTIPAKAIILGGAIDITTTLTSGGSATIALGTSAGSSATALKAATAVATWAAGVTVPVVPVFTAATYLKLTAAGRPTLTVATADLTAGKFDVNLVYVLGN